MTSKKLISLIVVIAGLILIALIFQAASGGSKDSANQLNPQNSVPVTPQAIQEIQSDLLGAESDAQWATSRLAVLRGPRPTPQQLAASQAQAATSRQALAQADLTAYDSSRDAVHKTDDFLDVNDQITQTHQAMLDILSTWKGDIDSGTPPANDDVNQYLSSIQQNLNDLQDLVGNLVPGPGLTQQQIDGYKSEMTDAIAEIDQTIQDLTDAQNKANTDQDNADTQQSVGDPAQIQNQQNTVVDDESKVADLQDQLDAAADNSDNSSNSGDTSGSGENPSQIIIPNDGSTNDEGQIIRINPEFDPTKPQLIQN